MKPQQRLLSKLYVPNAIPLNMVFCAFIKAAVPDRESRGNGLNSGTYRCIHGRDFVAGRTARAMRRNRSLGRRSARRQLVCNFILHGLYNLVPVHGTVSHNGAGTFGVAVVSRGGLLAVHVVPDGILLYFVKGALHCTRARSLHCIAVVAHTVLLGFIGGECPRERARDERPHRWKAAANDPDVDLHQTTRGPVSKES